MLDFIKFLVKNHKKIDVYKIYKACELLMNKLSNF